MAFLKPNYAKVGPGVSKNAPQKKRFFRFWEIVWRKKGALILINVLFFVCCLPIVTIGPALAGMMLVMRNVANGTPTFAAHDFFDGFRKNFKQALPAGILMILAFAVDIFGIWFYYAMAADPASGMQMFGMVALIVVLGVGFMLLFSAYYLFLLMVTCDLSFKALLKNSVILAMAGLKTNILTVLGQLALLAITAAPLFIAIGLYPVTAIILVLFGFSLPALLVAFNSYQYITKYVTDPYYAEHEDEKPQNDTEAVFADVVGTDEA